MVVLVTAFDQNFLRKKCNSRSGLKGFAVLCTCLYNSDCSVEGSQVIVSLGICVRLTQ